MCLVLSCFDKVPTGNNQQSARLRLRRARNLRGGARERGRDRDTLGARWAVPPLGSPLGSAQGEGVAARSHAG